MAEDAPKIPKIIHKHLYTDRGDHVSYRNGSHYDNDPALEPDHPDEKEFDHPLSPEELKQHFPNVKAPE